MPVLRVFGRKRLRRAQAQKWERTQQVEQARTNEEGNGQEGQSAIPAGNGQEGQNTISVGNGWAGQGMTRTTQTARLTRPLEVESKWIGTRRYFANLPYALPKDAPEADRLNFQHYYFRRLFKSLYLAPLEKRRLTSVLDVGCGTGRWACEMAQEFPRARVVGLDIEPPRPGALVMPPNLTFTSGNVLERLPFADCSFDFVHQRLLVAAIPTVQWPMVVAELARVTCPGGWIELTEIGDTYLHIGPALSQFLRWSRTIGEARGIEIGRVAFLDELLIGAGLGRVEKRVLRVPIGSWGGRMGSTLAQNMLAALEGLRGLFCQSVPLHPEQFDGMLAVLADEWNAYRTEFAIFVAHGQVCEER